MNKRNILLSVYLAGAILGALWLVYDNLRLPDISEIEQQVNELLLKTQSDNAIVNEAVLRSRENLDVSYDYLTSRTLLLREDLGKLIQLGQEKNDPNLLNASQKYQDSVNEKLDNIERFKSHNSILKNSLRYAPTVGLDLADIADQEKISDLTLLYLKAVSQMQKYAATNDSADKQAFQKLLTAVESSKNQLPEKYYTKQLEFLLHANTVSQELDQLRRFVNLIIADNQEDLNHLAQQWQLWGKQQGERVDYYNLYIIIYISYLVLGLIILLYWLHSVYLSLDKKVVERTQELEAAYEELQQSQIKMVQSEKMALLGQMIAGVAHEVNTPLGYVKNNVTLIRDLMGEYDRVIDSALKLKFDGRDDLKLLKLIYHQADEIEKDGIRAEEKQLFEDTLFGIDQIAELVVNLRNFARLDEDKIKHIDIRDCIDSSLNIAKNHVKHFNIERRYKNKNAPLIDCSPAQINQVLLNLFNNAVQAMEESTGKLIIDIGIHDNFLYIDVIDNGHGMDKETQAKIFTPFFTTKKAGQGTGLGLAICQQIMESHGGKIKVDSRLDKGTVFRVFLPLISPVKKTESIE